MQCRYCGATLAPDVPRCGKCQRRVSLSSREQPSGFYPVVDTAAAPDYYAHAEPEPTAAPPRFEAFDGGVSVGRRGPAVQPSLFPSNSDSRVVSMETYAPSLRGTPHRAQKSGPVSRKGTGRSRSSQDQTAFDFDPSLPSQPFAREMRRSTSFEVAPLTLRAMSALIDFGMVAVFAAVFLASIRVWLGYVPTAQGALIAYGAASFVIALTYKLVWSLFGEGSVGLQCLRLRVIGFDGQRPSFGQRVVRIFGGCLSVAGAALGLLWALVDQEALTWHDHMTQTLITVDDPAYD